MLHAGLDMENILALKKLRVWVGTHTHNVSTHTEKVQTRYQSDVVLEIKTYGYSKERR